jgi:uncharacterized protein YPO0396
MEVYNWGTFDKKVWCIEPQGETSLLTGANGSGKTTFVDALLTLMVPERRYRFYNQSSGSEKKGDRTEESYVMGAYSTVPSEIGSGVKTVYLREDREAAYSILLASFANEAGQAVTLFQVRYFSGSEMKRVFGIAQKALRITPDFTPFELSNWRRRLDQQYNKGGSRVVEWPESASRYAQRLTEVLGMQSIQALSLFNQTVGIKVLGDLNEFIRSNMLEPRNMEASFLELKQHLATLLDAQRNIEKTELQIALLRPLQAQYTSFCQYREQVAAARQEVEVIKVWNTYTRYHLLHAEIDKQEENLRMHEKALEGVKQSAETLLETERSIRNQIEQNKAGQRLKQLEQDMKALQQALVAAEKAQRQFTDWCKQLGLPEEAPQDESSYQRIQKEADRLGKGLATRIRNNDEEWYEATDQLKGARSELVTLNADLELLLQHRNNIPGHLLQLRKELCAALHLDVSVLPFAGELMQVRPEEAEWQPALEKLLHSFALRLLVPEKHYKKVNRYINNTNLRARLVYHQVHDPGILSRPEGGTVYEKLEFLEEHSLSAWVQQQVIRQFSYSCLETEAELDRYDFALTLNGLVKNRDRHEKDDRPERNDASRYVMGWNNEKKKAAMQARRQQLNTLIEGATETLARAERRKKRLQEDAFCVKRIAEHEGFALIDTAGVQRKIHKAETEILQLKESSDQLKALTEQVAALEKEKLLVEQERDRLGEAIGSAKALLQQLQEQQDHYQPLLSLLTTEDKDRLLQFQQQHGKAVSEVSLATIEGCYAQLKAAAETLIERSTQEKTRAEREVERSINKLKSPALETLQRFTDWAADVQGLPGEVEFAQEYMDWLERLESENLPKYKKAFERLIHDTAVIKMGMLNAELEQWEQRIRQSIETLNGSLAGIHFNRNPHTYIRLEHKAVADTAIKEFRHKLLASLPQGKNWQQSGFDEKEAHFRQHVQPLIAQLEESESYRAKVLDVRNWFEFWADERYRNTGELRKAYRQMGQLSGGEKAQLTYTILCSAIAYQFGITKEGYNARSLRFIAVDESFSNQDEEKATYLMELCKQLHLQLLVVTPSDKIQLVEEFIAHVHLVQRRSNGESVLLNMTKKELKAKREAVSEGDAVVTPVS